MTDTAPPENTNEANLPDELVGWATVNEDRSVTLRLAEPVALPGGKSITEITARRPKGKHMRVLGTDRSMGGQMDFVAGLAGQGSLFVDGLDAADAMRVTAIANFFCETGPPTGRP